MESIDKSKSSGFAAMESIWNYEIADVSRMLTSMKEYVRKDA